MLITFLDHAQYQAQKKWSVPHVQYSGVKGNEFSRAQSVSEWRAMPERSWSHGQPCKMTVICTLRLLWSHTYSVSLLADMVNLVAHQLDTLEKSVLSNGKVHTDCLCHWVGIHCCACILYEPTQPPKNKNVTAWSWPCVTSGVCRCQLIFTSPVNTMCDP